MLLRNKGAEKERLFFVKEHVGIDHGSYILIRMRRSNDYLFFKYRFEILAIYPRNTWLPHSFVKNSSALIIRVSSRYLNSEFLLVKFLRISSEFNFDSDLTIRSDCPLTRSYCPLPYFQLIIHSLSHLNKSFQNHFFQKIQFILQCFCHL